MNTVGAEVAAVCHRSRYHVLYTGLNSADHVLLKQRASSCLVAVHSRRAQTQSQAGLSARSKKKDPHPQSSWCTHLSEGT